MATIKLTLTEDHLKLISALSFNKFDFGDDVKYGHMGWGIDQWNMFGGIYIIDNIAMIIGKYDQVIPSTIENTYGGRYPYELEKYLIELYEFMFSNMENIMTLLIQFSCKGGLEATSYKCKDYEMIWEKEL